jgi:hypothetical protein
LALVPCDAGSMLMHADNGGVDHLNSGIMGGGKRFYDAAANTGPPPPNEAVVASGVWPNAAGRSSQGAPDRRTQKMPFRTRLSFTRGTPRGLFGSKGLMAVHSWSASS